MAEVHCYCMLKRLERRVHSEKREMKMIQKVLMFVVALALVVPTLATAEAKQRRGGGDVVVHDRLGPVVAHRLVPPYAGKHVYVRPGR